MLKLMQIGILSSKSGCSIQTIRYYEKQKLLNQPIRTISNYRVYNESDLSQLVFIKQCRTLGISISEIQTLLETRSDPSNSCLSINQIIEKHLAEVILRIKELNQLKTTLTDMASNCTDARLVSNCGVLKQLESD